VQLGGFGARARNKEVHFFDVGEGPRAKIAMELIEHDEREQRKEKKDAR
jgi:hypothetical protein